MAANQLREEKDYNTSKGSASSSLCSTSEHNLSTNNNTQSLDPDIEHGIPVIDPTQDVDVKEASTDITPASDPNIIDWTGTDDPRRPLNWSKKKKWSNLAIISCLTFLTPLASSMVAPATPLIMKDFKFNDETIASFIVSIYVLGYAVGPLFLAPMSEVYGRLPMYHACNITMLIFTIACAVAPNIGALLAFRLLAGIAGSCPITIGGGSIADVFIQQERGGAMAIFALGPLVGPVLGPVAGGFLAQAEGWRWIFWVIAITTGVVAIFSLTLQRETYEPVLLQRIVDAEIKATGNTALRSKLDSGVTRQQHFLRAIVRPTKMLLFSPIVLILSVYMAVVYGYLYLLFTTLTPVYEGIYHFSQGTVGLTYLGIGLGSLIGLFIFGALSDKIVKRMSRDGEMKPEYRLPPLIPGSLLIPIGLFWYGWSVDKHIHWIMGVVGTLWVGLGILATFMPIQTYMVDAFSKYAASAIAANTVLRSLVGAFLPLAGPKMYAALGLGWGNSLLAFIALVMAPISWILFRYGEIIRKKYWIEF